MVLLLVCCCRRIVGYLTLWSFLFFLFIESLAFGILFFCSNYDIYHQMLNAPPDKLFWSGGYLRVHGKTKETCHFCPCPLNSHERLQGLGGHESNFLQNAKHQSCCQWSTSDFNRVGATCEQKVVGKEIPHSIILFAHICQIILNICHVANKLS